MTPDSTFHHFFMPFFCLLMKMLRFSKVPFLALLPFYTDLEFVFNFAIPSLTSAQTTPDSTSTYSPGLLDTSPWVYTSAKDSLCTEGSHHLSLQTYFSFSIIHLVNGILI